MVWDGFIASYLFLAGLGAGAFVVGVFSRWSKTALPTIKKIAFFLAPVTVALGTLVLVFDAKAGLGNPLRFFLLVSNPTSVMSWGTTILSIFLIVSCIALIVLLVKKHTPKVLDVVGGVLAVCVAAYTGVLLGEAQIAFPLWNISLLPVLFVVSAASTGTAAVLFISRLVAPDEVKGLALVSRATLVLPVIEFVLVGALLVITATVGGSAGGAAVASLGNLLNGSYAVAFWGGFIVVGLVLPFCIEMLRRKRVFGAAANSTVVSLARFDGALALVGEGGVLVGGFLLRYLVIMAAVAVVFS